MNLYKALGEHAKAKTQWKELSANEKRDFSDWVEQGKDKEDRAIRVAKACVMIAVGKKRP